MLKCNGVCCSCHWLFVWRRGDTPSVERDKINIQAHTHTQIEWMRERERERERERKRHAQRSELAECKERTEGRVFFPTISLKVSHYEPSIRRLSTGHRHRRCRVTGLRGRIWRSSGLLLTTLAFFLAPCRKCNHPSSPLMYFSLSLMSFMSFSYKTQLSRHSW